MRHRPTAPQRRAPEYDYTSYSRLAGPLTEPPVEEPYVVRSTRLRDHRAIRTFLIAVAALGLELVFIVWLLQPEHLPGGEQSGAVHLASMFVVGSIALIESFRLLNVSALCLATIKARDPVPVTPESGTRIAFLTTIVPGKEPFAIVERTLAAALAVRHAGPLDVWLLDEGDAPEIRAACARLGVRHFSRRGVERWNRVAGPHRAKTKHGNYNAWLEAHGDDYDFFVSVDPDHVPLGNFCERLLGYFRDPDVAFVVGPQVYGNFDGFVTRAAESQQYLFHSLLQRAANRNWCAMLVGTNNAVRISALRSIGGLQDSITEDMATSLAIHRRRNTATGRRWKSVYTPDVLAVGEGPSSWTDFFNQQLRWARGTCDVVVRSFWRTGWTLGPGRWLQYALLLAYYPTTAAAWTLGVLNGLIYLTLGIGGLTVEPALWLMLYGDAALFAVTLYFWNRRHNVSPHERRGSSGVSGMFISVLSAPLYAAALAGALSGRAARFVVTPKGDSTNGDRLRTFRLQLAWGAVIAVALVASLALGNGHPAMRIWSGLALLTCLLPIVIWRIERVWSASRYRAAAPAATPLPAVPAAPAPAPLARDTERQLEVVR